MSVQLIIYPQSFDGTANTYSTTATEFIVNGIDFFNLNTASIFESSLLPPYEDVVLNAPPTILNTWYRFRTSGFAVDYPSVVSGNLVLDSINMSTVTGIYQKVSNLVVGAGYGLTVDIVAPTTGTIGIAIFDGNNAYAGGGGAAVGGILSYTFSAQAEESTVMVYYIAPGVDTVEINSISLQPVLGSVTGNAIEILGDGQVICDLYEDEDLPLTLSVDDFKNVAEKVQSYSKAFNLPSTKRNSRIFDAIFEVTRSSDGIIFNPYRKTQCVLKQDGFILFEGYLRLLDVSDKSGEISYNVNLYSQTIALADTLQEKTFMDLDFTELEHDYNKTQIKDSWNDGVTVGQLTPITWTNANTSGYRTDFNTLKYPFVDWNHQFLVGGSGSGSGATDGNPEMIKLETAFRPFINIKYLIDKIFADSPFTYDSTFFNTTDFSKLYMDFNWGSGNVPVIFSNSNVLCLENDFNIPASFTTIPFLNMVNSGGTALDPNFGYTSGAFTAQEDGQVYSINYNMEFNLAGLGASGTLDVQWLVNGVPFNVEPTQNNDFTYSGNFTTPPLAAGQTVLCQAKSTVSIGGSWEVNGVFPTFLTTSPTLVTVTTSVAQTTNNTLLGTLRGELGQWEFLKGLITMFNLVTLPDENNPNNINIETYSDVFINSTDSVQLDWTEKIDISQIKLTPLTDLNRNTIFKFTEDDDDYAFNQYKDLVGGHLYGSQKYDAGSEFNILEGTEEIIAEPFAATLVKPLMSQYPDFITPAVYANGGDGEWEGFDNSPRIMYDNGIKSTGTTYYMPEQNGLSSENQEFFLQFSHLSTIPSTSASLDCHFGICQLLPGVGTPTANNLFNLYWLPYYSELYNPNTRTMTIKVNLNAADINTFKFNDTIFIKNRVFRVNKIDYKPNDLATVEFILIP